MALLEGERSAALVDDRPFMLPLGLLGHHAEVVDVRALDDGQANRSRWPVDPTWQLLQSDYARLAEAEPLGEDAREVVRGARYDGKRRILRRLLLGITASLEVEDAAPTSAALARLKQWSERAAAHEEQRAADRRAACRSRRSESCPFACRCAFPPRRAR